MITARSARRGFSLVEVLLALALLAGVLLVLVRLLLAGGTALQEPIQKRLPPRTKKAPEDS